MSAPRFGSALCGALLSFMMSAPPELGRYAGVALWFVIVDTLTGVLAARRLHGMSSAQFRLKLKDKLVCYGLILSLAAGVSVLAQTWVWLTAGWWAVCAAETISIGENLRNLLAVAGPSLAPVAALLDRLLGVLSKADDQAPTSTPQPSASPEENTNGQSV
jgi:hypothetical protein